MVTGIRAEAQARAEAGTRTGGAGDTAAERLGFLRELAGGVPDPELPVVSLAELGVLRSVRETGAGTVEVDLTPTYTGCPAIETMAADVAQVLRDHGVRDVAVRTVLAPPWSTDDITDEGRRKLAEFGVAPPRTDHGPRTGPVPVGLGPTRTRPGGPTGDGTGGPRASEPHAVSPHAVDITYAADGPHTVEIPYATDLRDPVRCPHCGSPETTLLSRFSSTACKALRRCETCREPFDHFKEL
ncbi:1,2-phenylacetyl-CoA epoxidase subunit PaaD [Streptomyces phytohabitans]